jgi:uncharacterized protein YgiM (DUF1202 family)
MGYVKKEETCPSCYGSGKGRDTSCPVCGGAGRRSGFEDEPCYYCSGRGMVEENCGACGGSGKVSSSVWEDDRSSSSSSYDNSNSYGNSSYYPSYSNSYDYDKRGFISSAFFGLLCGFGIAMIIGWVFINITGVYLFPKMPFLILMGIFTVITFIAWRNRKTFLFILMLALSVPGLLATVGIIPERIGGISVAQSGTTATVTSDDLNFRSGPSTSHDVIKTLKQADTVTITGKIENGWAPIKHGNDTGYVSAELINMKQ